MPGSLPIAGQEFRARELYARADADGELTGTVHLGLMWEHGRGGEVDKERLIRYARPLVVVNIFGFI